MTPRRTAKREDLKDRLIEAAQARIRASGLQGLRARDVTADAGCALGALYNAFADLDDLILHVNSLTLASLGAALDREAARAIDPRAKFKALAKAYLTFARDNRALWAALFEHRLQPGTTAPDWYLQEQAVLIQDLVAPLGMLRPELDKSALLVRARTLFSAVHGIVAISLEDRFIGLAPTDLEDEVLSFVDSMVTGIENTVRT
jgi:AcrR family transcriptional regulator